MPYEAYGSGELLLRTNYKISPGEIAHKIKYLKSEGVLKAITIGDMYYSKYEKGYVFELYHTGPYQKLLVKKDLAEIHGVFKHALVSGGVEFTGDDNASWSFTYDGNGFAEWNIDSPDEYTFPECSNDKCVFNCVGIHPMLGYSVNDLTRRCCAPPRLKQPPALIALDQTRTRIAECYAYVDKADVKFQTFHNKPSSGRKPLRSSRTVNLLKRIVPNALDSCESFMLMLKSDAAHESITDVYNAIEVALNTAGVKPCDITLKVLDILEDENHHDIRVVAGIYGEYYTLDEAIYNERALSAGDAN